MARRSDPSPAPRVVYYPWATAPAAPLTPARRREMQARFLAWEARQEALRASESRFRLRTISTGVTIGVALVIAAGAGLWWLMGELAAAAEGHSFTADSLVIRTLLAFVIGGGGFTFSLRRPKNKKKD